MPTHEKVAPSLLVHLRRARDHVDRHYREPLDLDVLAAVAGVSTYHFDEELSAAGVESVQEPADRPYGVEAVMRDVSGNWLGLVESRAFTPDAAQAP